MKEFKYVLIFVLFCLITNVKAGECTNEELNRLRELAKQVEFKQDMYVEAIRDEENNDSLYVLYNLNVVNYNNDLSIFMKKSYETDFKKVSVDQINQEYFSEGESVTFKIYSYTANSCTNDLLLTKTVKFDYYNKYYYYHKDKCNEYPDFKYCKEFMKIDKSDEEIDKLFDTYIKDNTIESNKGILNNNVARYIIIGFVVLLLIVSITIFIIKRKKKNDI